MSKGSDYEAEYDNRARVPDHPAIIDGWRRDAAAAREALDGRLDIAYGPEPRQTLDLFRPRAAREVACVMFVHGGYWRAFDQRAFSHMACGLTAHGISVALPGYRLCPSVRIGDIIADVRAALLRIAGLMGRRVVAVGHSAGGHLAACLVATDWPAFDSTLAADLVPAAYSISGLFDLEPLRRTSINDTLGMDEAEARALSPVHWPPPKGRVLDAMVGERESAEYLRQSREIVERWGAGGVEARFGLMPGANHFTAIAPLADPSSEMTERIASLAVAAA